MNLNGRERSEHAFSELFASVSPELKLVKVHRPSMGELSLIEVKLAQDNIVRDTIGQALSPNELATNGHMVNGSTCIREETVRNEEIAV